MLSNMEFEATPSPSLNDADSTLESLVVIGVRPDIWAQKITIQYTYIYIYLCIGKRNIFSSYPMVIDIYYIQ